MTEVAGRVGIAIAILGAIVIVSVFALYLPLWAVAPGLVAALIYEWWMFKLAYRVAGWPMGRLKDLWSRG